MNAPKRVLVVDDHPDIRDFVACGLRGAGFDVEVAADGREAMARQQSRAADVLIADIFMPEMDGIEAIDHVHAAYPGTRIVAMSSGSRRMQDYLRVAREIGADATLAKPFAIGELVALVRRLADAP
jgi:CheY-like chemotaxis protein